MMRRILRKLRLGMIRLGLVRSKSFVVNGLPVTLPDISRSNILKAIALDGFESYESELVTFLKGYPYAIGLFVDGGANIGFYSILAQAYFPSRTRIVAVEPFSGNVAYLCRIKELNGFRFEMVEGALDRTGGIMKTIYYPTASSSSKLSCNATLVNQFKGTAGLYCDLDYRSEQVRTVSLESVFERCDAAALVKLDVELNNFPILQTSERLLSCADIDFILELVMNDPDNNKVFQLMVKHGYRAYLITNAGLVREDRPLILPKSTRNDRALWNNHFFSKRDEDEISVFSRRAYGNYI